MNWIEKTLYVTKLFTKTIYIKDIHGHWTVLYDKYEDIAALVLIRGEVFIFPYALTLSSKTVGNMYWFNGLLSPFTYFQLSFKPSENISCKPVHPFPSFSRKTQTYFYTISNYFWTITFLFQLQIHIQRQVSPNPSISSSTFCTFFPMSFPSRHV